MPDKDVKADTVSSQPAERFYSVDWPDDWAVDDVIGTVASNDYSNAVHYFGGRPSGQTTLFQHAIVVCDDEKESVIEDIKKRRVEGTNGDLVSMESGDVNGIPAEILVVQNKVDTTNKTTFYLMEQDDLVYVIHIHGPSAHATYLNDAADVLLGSFKIAH